MFIFRLIIALFVATNSQHTLHTYSIHILIPNNNNNNAIYSILYQKSLELSTHKLIAHKVAKLWLLYTTVSVSVSVLFLFFYVFFVFRIRFFLPTTFYVSLICVNGDFAKSIVTDPSICVLYITVIWTIYYLFITHVVGSKTGII